MEDFSGTHFAAFRAVHVFLQRRGLLQTGSLPMARAVQVQSVNYPSGT